MRAGEIAVSPDKAVELQTGEISIEILVEDLTPVPAVELGCL